MELFMTDPALFRTALPIFGGCGGIGGALVVIHDAVSDQEEWLTTFHHTKHVLKDMYQQLNSFFLCKQIVNGGNE